MKHLYAILVSAACLLPLFTQAASPTVVSVSPTPGTVTSLTQLTVTFSTPVANIFPADLLLNGLPLAADVQVNGAVCVFNLSQPDYGTVAVSWDPGHNISDLSDPPNRFNETGPGATWQYTLIDNLPPVVQSLTPPSGASVRSLTQIEVRFSEAMAGVEAGDLLVNGSPASGLTLLGVGGYRFSFTQPVTGAVQVAWANGHGIRDLANNAFAGGSWSYTLDPNQGLPSLRINEFMAANASGLADENAEFQDWIEIGNYGTTTVNLNGYSLTDDPDDPGKWVFPSTNLAPGQLLVVFASEKDRRAPATAALRFHTNFKLNPGGEYLALFNAESPRVPISQFNEYPEQRNNISYGFRTSDQAYVYFSTATPGAANGEAAVAGILSQPHFNVRRGLYDQPFDLILSTTESGATIRFTTDGNEPTTTNGVAYTGRFTITNTVVVRAATFRTNALPSSTVTHSYLFMEQIVNQPRNPAGFPNHWGTNLAQVGSAVFSPASTVPGFVPADYEMDKDPLRVDPLNTNSPIDPAKLQRLRDGLREIPTLSVVMKTDDIFGTNGIYLRSAVETGTPGTKPENKKPCSVELILPDGTTAFATTCGIDLHGNASRNPTKNPKHGFKLKFKGDFGPGSLNYRLFEDSEVEEYDDILLRADFNSSWRHWSDTAGQSLGALQRTRATRTRDAWMKDSMRAMGGLSSHSRFVHLYLNGLYWGTYDLSEDPTETFAKTALGGTESDYDIVDQGFIKNGTINAYNAMLALPAASTLPQYDAYSQHLNVPEFADYMLLHFFMGHQDWATVATKNWAALRKRVAGPEGTFRYMPWDGECILLSEDVNRTTNTSTANFPSGLQPKLATHAEYRLLFADRAHRHMIAAGGGLTPSQNITRWQKWQAVLDKPIVAESVRWGDYRRDVHQSSEGTYQLYTREGHWLPENNRMLGYFSNRTATVLTQLRQTGLYPTNVGAVTFNQQGGLVARGFNLTMSATNSIYYTLDGSDPRVYGTSAISPGATLYSGAITLSNSVVVKARGLAGTNWSALNETTFTVDALGSPLRITEIMYNPIGGDAYEYIELQNVSGTILNIGLFAIDGIDFSFAPNTMLAPGQVIVLGSSLSPGNWAIRYPSATAFARFDGKLDNGGEELVIRDPSGRALYSVNYNDEAGWPAKADGVGYSIEIVDVFGNQDDPANWRVSGAVNGTPGSITPPPAPSPNIILNEIMADNGVIASIPGVHPDWVELYNRGAQPVNLGGWSLTDNSDPRRYVFPSTNVPPGGYVFVYLGIPGTNNELTAPFGLGRTEESLFLYDSNTNLVDAIGFGLQLTNYSIGRVGGTWQLTQPTPKTANVAAALAPISQLVINEWMANSVGDDWVELHNRSAVAPVAVGGAYMALGNTVHQLTPLSFIAPGGFAQYLADGNVGGNHVSFTLPNTGGTIVLYDANATELDRITYGPQAQGVSQGRLPDGAVSVVNFPSSPSPDASNYLFNYSGPFLNEVLAINRTAVTNGAGRTADFVELRNTNGASADLSGMRLSTDPENASQWTFPSGVSIPGNGHLVVWFDNERPASTANGAVLNTGVSIDGDSGEVWLFNAAGQPVDSVVFGPQVDDLSIGRAGSTWSLLTAPTPAAANAGAAPLASPDGLRINEWFAASANEDDWFELFNGASQPVALAGLYLTDDASLQGVVPPIAPLSYVGAKGFVRFTADATPTAGRHHVGFSLDGEGELVRLSSASGSAIDAVYFGLQTEGVSEGRVPDGGDTAVQFPGSSTPGRSNYRPLSNVVINEVLTHTDPPLEDAVELYNPTSQAVDLSGWFLSDDDRDPKKFKIADGTTLPAGGYLVFYEAQLNSGAPGSFTFDSAQGDEVMLSEADAAGNLSGYRAVARFGAAANGVSFGRYETCSGTDFVAMTARTFGVDNPGTVAQFRSGAGLFNSLPRVGPVVINEIMYHPPDLATNDNDVDEFIELRNVSAASVSLFDPAQPQNTWRLREGVQFNFPQGVTLPANGYALVVSFNPLSGTQLATFRGKYGVPAGVPVYGPYTGKLDNGGERVELLRPDNPQAGTGYVPYMVVDRIDYSDDAPWPASGDGDGASLQRSFSGEFGNDAANWSAASPSAGAANPSQPARTPEIASQPISRTVPAQTRVVFSVSVCGNLPVTYQWRKNGGNLSNATNASHVIPSAGAGDVGNYTVFVSTAGGSLLSDVASLALGEPPQIVTQPQPASATAGESASFTVEASGPGPLRYQWRRNGLPIDGATNATLVISNVRRVDAGDYSVVVMNDAGSVASATARLTPLIPPTITTHPLSQIVNPGANVTFTAAGSGVGVIRYQWQFNGVNIPGATNATFTTNGVQLANEGDYRVLVTDDITTGPSLVARLTVRVPPTILSVSPGVTNAVGSSFTLSVRASGSVPMGFEWRRGSAPVTNLVLMTTNSSITINNPQLVDAGTYRVILTNSGYMGIQSNTTFTVRIVAPPVITAHPTNQTVVEGTNVTFSVGVSGTTPFNYQWQRGASDLQNATNATLSLTNVQPAQEGSYRVVVTNLAGVAVSSGATLTVINLSPTLLQNIEILGNGSVRFGLSGRANRNYAIEVSTNLVSWDPLQTLQYTNGVMPVTDAGTAGSTNRFYRARLLDP